MLVFPTIICSFELLTPTLDPNRNQTLSGEDCVRNRNGIYGTPAAARTLDRLKSRVLENGGDVNKTVFGLIVPWSDGFVSNWVRQKDNNVWIKTVTICPPANGKKGNKNSTDSHVVVMGLSKHSHSNVVSATVDEIAMIEKGVTRLSYQGGTPRLLMTSFGIVSYVRLLFSFVLVHSMSSFLFTACLCIR